VDPGTRTAILVAGVTFCALFGALTIAVAIDNGFTVFTVIGLLIVAMIASGLIGAIRNPPPDD
jgi:hypothetical protein